MNILLKTKGDVEEHFGEKAVMGGNLLGVRGEEAFRFLTGAMDGGWDITVGFFNQKARYVAFKKRTGTKWSEADLRACLTQIGRYKDWFFGSNPEYFDYTEKKGDEIVAEATGWKPKNRGYAFVYVPQVPGEIGLMPDKTALDQKFPTEGMTKAKKVGRGKS
jgi:hypothetical protein